MLKFSIAAAALVAGLAAATPAAAQMDAQAYFNAQNRAMEEAIARASGNIVRQNMNDPRMPAMYQQALRQGYRGSFQQFSYDYAATGGFTPEGRAFYAENERRNHANEVGAVRRYQGAVDNLGRAIQDRNDHAGRNLNDGGLGLQGRQRYYDPAAGRQTERSYLAPGDNGYDPRTGRYYRQDARGNYMSCGNDGCVYVAPAR